MMHNTHRSLYFLLALALITSLLAATAQPGLAATLSRARTDITGPTGSGAFGANVYFLPNGNLVVTDPQFSSGGIQKIGAVYLYNAQTRDLISTLTGSLANDQVGSSGIFILENGSFLVSSPYWANGSASNAGALTLCSGVTGCQGQVSASNSLVGGTTNDNAGSSIYYLGSDYFVVSSPHWSSPGTTSQAGAVTRCPNTGPCSGLISSSNSLVGTYGMDQIGSSGIITWSDGHYLVTSQMWKYATGAVTYCSNSCIGFVNESNSLVGSTADDQVGSRIRTLNDGKYLVVSNKWDNGNNHDVGAITFCQSSGCFGKVDSANSLVGSKSGDKIGSSWIQTLANGKYLVFSPNWSNGDASNAGAVTLCSGSIGCTGPVSETNSLVGGTTDDQVGSSVYYSGLNNNRYLVLSPSWDNGSLADVGAVTLCSADTGCTGPVSETNSLVGNHAGDGSGLRVSSTLTSSTYMVAFPKWDMNNTSDVGAVTWCSSTTGCTGQLDFYKILRGSSANDQVGSWIHDTGLGGIIASFYWDGAAADTGALTVCTQLNGCTGPVSDTNSLVGSQTNDQVGSGTYDWNASTLVFLNRTWHNNTGAVTVCSWSGFCSGTVSDGNSLVGSTTGDQLGSAGFQLLPGGGYVIASPYWDNSTIGDAGAVTWCANANGCTGYISTSNSLVGIHPNDQVGSRFYMRSNGNLITSTPYWDNGSLADVGAFTYCLGACVGQVSTTNSLVGNAAGDQFGSWLDYIYGVDYALIFSPSVDSGAAADVGNVAFCSGPGLCRGTLASYTKYITGGAAGAGSQLTHVYDDAHHLLAVGRPAENRVSLLDVNLNDFFVPVVRR